MARTKVKQTYDELISLACEYGVDGNALFLAAAKQYDLQMKVIDKIRQAIEESDSMTCEKVYRGKEKNLYADPLIKELPRHTDSANKTLLTMLDIINKLGHKTEKKSALTAFNEEFE